ncbi:RagB/SusD family nutrient uptake outer membrane protein [uncultured Proteiniphilum sp.]|uniref:RagB/SusD family nutrient uptake outer membrane protein n=1 Tax=uncultured Proteiniphilum sp. TaxID=497637 RepID=UPI00263105DA|nr:RagB/SusD family nutrient uptake outer membrane protein [uncultured Proteiniphilum sp.]
MKNSIIKTVFIFVFVVFTTNCADYLDVVPNDVPRIEHAFSNRATAERFLFSCYSFLPNIIHMWNYPAYFDNLDEFDVSGGNYTIAFQGTAAGKISYGGQNSESPLQNYWSGGNGGTNLFLAIRQCNIFLEEIHTPRDIEERERARWIAEVTFLKAYYHFFLLQLYGPIPLIKENIPLSAPPEDTWVFREPVDECVDYIVELLDEASPNLPMLIDNPIEEDGRITRPIALAIKAKVLALGASPLFNGNPDYINWVDSRNKQLVSPAYSKDKWVRAADAIKAAIDTCHNAGLELYVYDKMSVASTSAMNDSLVKLMHVRKGFTERWNKGVIWTDTRLVGDLQRLSLPIMKPVDIGKITPRFYASFHMTELFYTNKGIPITEDPDWNYDARYQLRVSTPEANHASYIPINERTVALHFDREPRFYANLGFDRGFFELSTLTTDRGKTFTPFLKARLGDVSNYESPASYYIKKLVAYESNANVSGAYVMNPYLFPVIRLADLYLLYSEALNEVYDTPNEEVHKWIDQVRAVTGLKGVAEAWEGSLSPNRPFDKNEMRKIIQQERMIELAFEGQRFWDVRRWKRINEFWTLPGRNWNNDGRAPEDYYQIVQTREPRKISVKDYLWPISLTDLRINRNLVQTWGW